MSKPLKLILAIFIGVDIFVVSYLALSQLRFMLFGEGQIPGGGSALDMALFLIPIFVAYVAGDRLFYFLTYKERKAAKLQQLATTQEQAAHPQQDSAALVSGSVWQERGWDDEIKSEKK